MIAESGPGGSSKSIAHGRSVARESSCRVDHRNPHTDTRLVHKLANGNYLVCHEADGVVREYDPGGR